MHLFLVLVYASLSLVLVFGLPALADGVSRLSAAALGGGLLLALAACHGALLLVRRSAVLERHLARVSAETASLRGDVTALRSELDAVDAAIKSTGGVRHSEAMLTEMRMLKSLVEKLEGARATGTHGAAAPVGPSVATAQPAALRAVPGGRSEDDAQTDGRAGPPPGVHLSLVDAPVIRGLDAGKILEIVRDGLNLGRVDLYLQPVVQLPQRRRRFYECFSRVRAEDGSVVLPENYIQVAEQAGIMGTIDNMLLFRCIQLVRKVQRRNQNTGFFCNVSPRTLEDRNFFLQFVEFMNENAGLAQNLIFELPQDSYDTMGPDMAHNLEALAEAGYRLSMDQVRDLDLDFARLQELGVRYVKIGADRIAEWLQRPETADSVRRLRGRLDRFGMNLVIEKIEGEDVLVEVLDTRADYGQGYLFGEPRLSREGA